MCMDTLRDCFYVLSCTITVLHEPENEGSTYLKGYSNDP